VSRDLRHGLETIAAGRASFETRADTEHALLNRLRDAGLDGLEATLRAAFADKVTRTPPDASGFEVRFVVEGLQEGLVVTAFSNGDVASVSIDAPSAPGQPQETDPRHDAFYTLYMSVEDTPWEAVSSLDPMRRAVFLVGLFEAQVMNGGVGQYLANTEGVFLTDTLASLVRIGALESAALLEEAAAIDSDAGTYVAAWAERPRDFERIDDRLLRVDEDWPPMAAATFELPGSPTG